MPGVLVKIRSLYPSLPAAERSVADYILQNAEQAPHSSVHEFARAGQVSVASVSRFVRKLGFGGFREFKLELARETTIDLRSLYQAITPDDSDPDIARKVFLGNIRSLEDTLKLLPVDDLVAAATAVSIAPRLVVFGIGGSGYIAHDTALRFSFLDFNAEGYSDASQILLHAMRLRPEDVAIGISHSGRTTMTVEGMRMAREKGASTIGIANNPRSPLKDASTWFFCTSFPESRVKMAVLSSRLAQLCVLDALYLLATRHREQLWDVAQVNTELDRMLRFKTR
jgi:RpiR family transcriptional regulator, carbohydrate utilization regulator